MVLLSVCDLHKRYGPDPVLDGVTFDVARASGLRWSVPTVRERPRS